MCAPIPLYAHRDPEPTRIVQAPVHQSAVRGTTARFDCKVNSDPTLPVTVTWTKDDKPLDLRWR